MADDMRTLGYICPKCGAQVMGARSVFALEASDAEIECSCGGSVLRTNYDGQNYHILVPCGVCGQTHEAVCPPERMLHAATAKIGNARADYYPKFKITGSISYEAPKIGSIVQNQYGTWSVGPSASWNIFQAGKTVYNVKLQEALTREAGVDWEDAVLTAVKEVEDALVSAKKERERIEYLNRIVDNYRKAFELSRELYTQGEIEFIDLLDAQRSMLSSEQSRVQSRRDFVNYIVALYKSLGGGWTEADVEDEPEKLEWIFFDSLGDNPPRSAKSD